MFYFCDVFLSLNFHDINITKKSNFYKLFLYFLYPHQESNLDLVFRRHLFYPLNYGDIYIFNSLSGLNVVYHSIILD